jgi:bla regulator protein BlaR1
MTPFYTSLANHLWQSTLLATIAGMLTLTLRKNHARTRHWVWLAASAKFLVPFALLVGAGSWLGPRETPTTPSIGVAFAMEEMSQPFGTAAAPAAPRRGAHSPISDGASLLAVALGVWMCGMVAVTFRWARRWRSIRATLRAAAPVDLGIGIPVLMSRASIEPGVFGIWRPVLLLPQGITARLSWPQLQAVIAHEICHVRRRDNLAAAIHMAVEAIFWFHPLVWWIGSRLVEERERACDEEVLRLGNEPTVYAEGILNVCKLYLESPLVCVSGVTGADLKARIVRIMTRPMVRGLDRGRKLLLALAAVAAVGVPIAVGIADAPRIRAQAQASSPPPAFEAASIKPVKPSEGRTRIRMSGPPGGINYENVSLMRCIQAAYGVAGYQVAGPDWLDLPRFDIVAKAAGAAPREQKMLMLQTLLADRFKLAVHRETKIMPGFVLMVAKNGPKLAKAKDPTGSDVDSGATPGSTRYHGVSMKLLAGSLARDLGQPIDDKTGLEGTFDFELAYAKEERATPSLAERGDPKAADPLPSLFTALQEQLGLKLEARKVPVEIVVVDHAEKVPTEN